MHILESILGTVIARLGHMLTHEVGQAILIDTTIWTTKSGKKQSGIGNDAE